MAKKLSPAMFAWAKANNSKLKNPTPAQKKIFATYAAMVKAGDKPANPKPRPTPKPAPKSNPNASKTKPAATTQSQTSDKAVEGGYTISQKNRQPKPSTRHRGGRRARVSSSSSAERRERLKAGASRVSEAARRLNPNPSSMAMGPAKNPQKGHTYKKPFGQVMVFNGTKYVPK